MKKIIVIIFTIGIIFSIGFLNSSSIPFSKESTLNMSVTHDITISTVADKDARVHSYYPSDNYGDAEYVLYGKYGSFGWVETYYHFDFSDKPITWTKATISLERYSASDNFYATVSLVEVSWNEATITWNNKPAHGEIIETFYIWTLSVVVDDAVVKNIDISNYIAGRSDISIVVKAYDSLETGHAQGRSKESSACPGNIGCPSLVWAYPENVEINVMSPSESDVCVVGETRDITWSTIGTTIVQVDIELYKGTTRIGYIDYNEDNDGLYSWDVPMEESGNDYQIKITDDDDSQVFDYSDYFTITTPPVINIDGYQLIIFISIISSIGLTTYLLRKKKILIS